MAKRTALIAIIPAATICALSACGGSSGGSASQAQAQTPQQQLASALVGETDTTTGATVTSATVGMMCSASYGPPAPCQTTGPISRWQNPGIYTFATGEVQMSDGNQYVVNIGVDNQGNITWTSQN
jgi:hypothetical protein